MVWSGLVCVWWGRGGTVGWFWLRLARGSGVVLTVGWFLPAVAHPVVVWEVVVNNDCGV